MIKAYPRGWVDLFTKEIIVALFHLLNFNKVRNRNLVPDFEKRFAEFIGTEHAVAFTNCRSSLYFCLKALNLEPDDEVILPSFTFWADAEVVVLAGLKPVFVDVEFKTMNLDAGKIEKAISPRTKVILPVHLNGLSLDMDHIVKIAKKFNLRIIEDCARSCGGIYNEKRVGSFDIGAFSFGYGKSFYSFGGGMVTTDDFEFSRRLRKIKNEFNVPSLSAIYNSVIKGCLLKYLNIPFLYGISLFPCVRRYELLSDERFAGLFRIQKPHYNSVPQGFEFDMFNLQAKVGVEQIEKLRAANKRRSRNLFILNNELSGIKEIKLPPEPDDRTNLGIHYAIWAERKNELKEFLIENRIDAQDESAQDVTKMKRFRKFASERFENASKLDGHVLFIPTHPFMREKSLLYIASKIKEYYRIH